MHLSWQHFQRTLAHELLLRGPDDHHAGFVGFTVDGVTISPNASDLITLSDGNGINLTGTTSTVTFNLGVLTATWAQTGVFDIQHSGNLKLVSTGDLILYSDAGITQTASWDTATGNMVIGPGAISASNAILVSRSFTDQAATILRISGTIARSLSSADVITGVDGTLTSVASAAAITMSGIHKSFNAHYSSLTGSAHTVSDYRGFHTGMAISASRGDVTNRYGMYIGDKTGGGVLTNQYGIYSELLDGAATLNYFIYSLGGKSVHLGPMRIGSVTDPTNVTDGDLTATRLIVPNATILHSAITQLGGPVVIPTGGVIRFSDADDSNYVGLRSPAVAPAANLVIHLPSDTPAAGEFLKVTAFSTPDITTEWTSFAQLPMAIVDGAIANATTPYLIARIPNACTIVSVHVKTNENVTIGATAWIGDIHKILAANVNTDGQGTTIYTTQGNRPTITNGNMGNTATAPDVTAIADGDYLAFYTDQAGTGAATISISLEVSVP